MCIFYKPCVANLIHGANKSSAFPFKCIIQINTAASLLPPACNTIGTPGLGTLTDGIHLPCPQQLYAAGFWHGWAQLWHRWVKSFAAWASAGSLGAGYSALSTRSLALTPPSCPGTSLPQRDLLRSQVHLVCQLRGFSMVGEALEELLGII